MEPNIRCSRFDVQLAFEPDTGHVFVVDPYAEKQKTENPDLSRDLKPIVHKGAKTEHGATSQLPPQYIR